MDTDEKPLVSLVLAAYNEAAILEENLTSLCTHMCSLEKEYRWELILVNDGSADATGELADGFACTHPKVYVLHHKQNLGLGKSLQDGFAASRGDYVVTLDIDLSCSPSHIDRLLEKIRSEDTNVVVASPIMKGGEMRNVPWHRKMLSICANRFLSFFSSVNISSFSCMVRAYNGPFIRTLSLRSDGMEIMPEIIHKTSIMRESVAQIPARLDWTDQVKPGYARRSSMKVISHTLATLFTGFLLRPFLFFILPGFFLLFFSLYPLFWMLVHFFNEYAGAVGLTILDRASHALEAAYQLHPHTYLIALLSLVLAIQLIALGFQVLLTKHYYEEIFSLATKIYRRDNDYLSTSARRGVPKARKTK